MKTRRPILQHIAVESGVIIVVNFVLFNDLINMEREKIDPWAAAAAAAERRLGRQPCSTPRPKKSK